MVLPISWGKTKTIPAGELLCTYFFNQWKKHLPKITVLLLKIRRLTRDWLRMNTIIQPRLFWFLRRPIICGEGIVAKVNAGIVPTKRKKIRAAL
jgi:hypothetical protein